MEAKSGLRAHSHSRSVKMLRGTLCFTVAIPVMYRLSPTVGLGRPGRIDSAAAVRLVVWRPDNQTHPDHGQAHARLLRGFQIRRDEWHEPTKPSQRGSIMTLGMFSETYEQRVVHHRGIYTRQGNGLVRQGNGREGNVSIFVVVGRHNSVSDALSVPDGLEWVWGVRALCERHYQARNPTFIAKSRSCARDPDSDQHIPALPRGGPLRVNRNTPFPLQSSG